MLRMTIPAIRVYLFCILLPLLLVGCGKEEGYEIRDGKVIWHSWRGDGLSGTWSEGVLLDDARGFTILQQQGYAKNAESVFHGSRKLDGADATTFELLDQSSGLAKDAKRVYLSGAVIAGADPATFALTGVEYLGRDNKDYYLGTAPLHVRDMSTFKTVKDNTFCSQDRDHCIWAWNKFDYYVGTQATPMADSNTFQVIQSSYAKDAKQVYFGSTVLAGADVASFQGIGGESGEFAKDAKHVYWNGEVVEGSDAKTFQLLKYRYAKDSKQAYFCYASGSPPLILAGSDAKTFEVIGPSTQGFGYAKDAKYVYQGANVITGADPATFVVDQGDPENASDKNQRYRNGEPVK